MTGLADNLAISISDPRKYKCWAGCNEGNDFVRPLASQFDDRKQKVLAVGRISPRCCRERVINNSNLVSRKWTTGAYP